MNGLGAGPDGLGWSGGNAARVPQEPATHYYPDAAGWVAPIEPAGTTGTDAIQSAGVAALLAAFGTGVGLAAGGPFGAGAGLMLAGAVSNGYRAQKWWNDPDPGKKHEAMVSVVFATFEVVMGSYMSYKAYQSRQGGRR